MERYKKDIRRHKKLAAVKHQNVAGRFHPAKSVQAESGLFCTMSRKNCPGRKILAETMIACSMACTTIAHFVNCLGY
jgi:hypothetical protein